MTKNKVLIVEDDRSLCSLLENILKPTYEIAAVYSSIEAWEWLSDGNYPALVLTDFQMPQINGLELAENIKTSGLFREIPILIISGKNEPGLKEKCEKLGVNAFFTKPFSPVLLIKAIEEILNIKKYSNV